MSLFNGEPYVDDYINVSNVAPNYAMGETAHSINGFSGNDTLIGSNLCTDFIDGGDGNDYCDGGAGDDFLLGGNGTDTLIGGIGNDTLNGQSGNDVLYGGAGSDQLWGGVGNDEYRHYLGDGGVDTINDDKSPTASTGYGGGTDTLRILDVSGNDLLFFMDGNNLLITDQFDINDGVFSDGVVIEDFFLGGNNVIEYAVGGDGIGYDLQQLLGPSMASQSLGNEIVALEMNSTDMWLA